ncbi:MAG: twin-arginine translocase TatA/TatE family subunit [Pseudonocardiaceae bacterium]
MGIPSGWELIVLLAVLVLLFGATKLPTAARSIGQSIRIFKAETGKTRSQDQEPDQASSPVSEHQSLPPSGPVAAGVYERKADEARVEEPRRPDGTTR